MKALVIGSAACMPADQAAALELFQPDVIVAVNHAGRDYPGPLDHWASFHPELLPRWIAQRAGSGLPDAGKLWTGHHRACPPHLAINRVRNWGGSSGLLAACVALEIGADRIVLVGIPLDYTQGHYDDPKPWRDAANYRKAWVSHLDQLANVRSMSGYTAEILGKPTKEWIEWKPEPREPSPS